MDEKVEAPQEKEVAAEEAKEEEAVPVRSQQSIASRFAKLIKPAPTTDPSRRTLRLSILVSLILYVFTSFRNKKTPSFLSFPLFHFRPPILFCDILNGLKFRSMIHLGRMMAS